jgi:integrase
MPMDYESWEAVFTAASERFERSGKPIRVSPHTCRHLFALKMLVTLQRGLDRRFGLDAGERDHLRKVYGNAFLLVKDLLGHRSEQTTRDIYLRAAQWNPSRADPGRYRGPGPDPRTGSGLQPAGDGHRSCRG